MLAIDYESQRNTSEVLTAKQQYITAIIYTEFYIIKFRERNLKYGLNDETLKF